MMQFEVAPGATPIDPNEATGLIPLHVTTQDQLNEVEAVNIANAMDWAVRRPANILDSKFVRQLHKRMFGEVWEWAGTFRRTDKNIGLPSEQVATALEELLRNTQYQIEHQVYAPDEIAIRFHHRLVAIHCFPNGNGRHARLLTDLLLTKVLRRPKFSWGEMSGSDAANIRTGYIAALQAADGGRFDDLLALVRS